MERMNVINVITVIGVALLALVPKMESMPIGVPAEPRPLCASQFQLANYACSRLPFVHGPPPSPPSDDDDHDHGDDHDHDEDHDHDHHDHDHDHHHGHHHRHGHRHHHHHNHQEEDCCRWVREVDSQCVCEVLLHLPPFLNRPVHRYTVTIGDFCNTTYSCGGPL